MNQIRVALSFDDGYHEQYLAAQLLHSLKIRATFFVITGREYWQPSPSEGLKLLVLRRKEILKKVSEMGHEIGSHTSTHPDITKIGEDRLREELDSSERFLQAVVNNGNMGMAYPYGRFNDVTKRIVKRYFAYARATEVSRGRADRFAIRACFFDSVPLSIDLLYSLRKQSCISIVLHTESPLKLLRWVQLLRFLNPKFVTLSELVEEGYSL